jgi:phage tail P2-like protein
MSSRLLPPNSTPLERALADVIARAVDIPVPIADLWNPATCPPACLPFLAWALSVDRWNMAWSDEAKRNVIAASFEVHKHKGTLSSLRRVVEPLGYLIDIEEWFETTPPGVPGTFRLRIGVLDTGITEESYAEIERLIDDAKPLTRHMGGLAIVLDTRGEVFVGASAYLGDVLTVYPWVPEDIVARGDALFAGGQHHIDTMTIYSRA